MKSKINWILWILAIIIAGGSLFVVFQDAHLFNTKQIDVTGFAEILIALATAILALVTFALVLESRKTRLENERIRKEEQHSDALMRLKLWAERTTQLVGQVYPIEKRCFSAEIKMGNGNITFWEVGNVFSIIKTESIGVEVDSKHLSKSSKELFEKVFENILNLNDPMLLLRPVDLSKIDKQISEIKDELKKFLESIKE